MLYRSAWSQSRVGLCWITGSIAWSSPGSSEARINSHAHAERLREYIGLVNSCGRIRLVESYEPKPLGSAGTVAANTNLAEFADEIVIIHADNLSDIDLRALLAFHWQHGDPLTMVLFRTPNLLPVASPI